MNTLTFRHSSPHHSNKKRNKKQRFNSSNDSFFVIGLNDTICSVAQHQDTIGSVSSIFDNLPALLKLYREKDLTAILDALPDGLGSDPSWAITILKFLGGLENA